MADEVYEITSDDIKPGELTTATLEQAKNKIAQLVDSHNSSLGKSEIENRLKISDFKITKITKKDKPKHWYFR